MHEIAERRRVEEQVRSQNIFLETLHDTSLGIVNRLDMQVEMDAALALRTQINESLKPEGVKVSVNDMVVRATALAIRLYELAMGGVTGLTGGASAGGSRVTA